MNTRNRGTTRVPIGSLLVSRVKDNVSMMTTSKSKRDYPFGQTMFTLRTAIGLTQEELGNRLGVSRRAVGKWEMGNSYPKPEYLKEVITLGVKSQAFSAGGEAEEIRALWKAAHQKLLLDEDWLCALLLGQAEAVYADDQKSMHIDRAGPLWEGFSSASVPGATDLPTDQGPGEDLTVPPASCDLDNASTTLPNLLRDVPLASPRKTSGRRKWLLYMLIALNILTITGWAGTFFFQTRESTSDRAYLAGSGKLAFFDPLRQARGSQWVEWIKPGYGRDACEFIGGAYHVIQDPAYGIPPCSAHGSFKNFVFEIQLTIVQGDCGGMYFRNTGSHIYYFSICQNGLYNVFDGSRNDFGVTLNLTSNSSAIHTGPGQQNTIAVEASDSRIIYYVNKQQIDQEQDSNPQFGGIGLIADTHYRNLTDVAFSNARVWTL